MNLLTVDDLAKEIPKLTPRRQKDLRARRQIGFHRIGHRTVVYSRRDVEKFLAGRRVEAMPWASGRGGGRK